MLPSSHNFLVGSNITSFFAIGDFLTKDDFYLIGWHEPNGRIVLSGKIYASNGNLLVEIENTQLTFNFNELFVLKTVGDNIVEVVDKKGTRIFYAETGEKTLRAGRGQFRGNVTEIQGRFYNKQGKLLAEGTKIGLELIGVKAVIGATKAGSLGMVLGCNEKETEFISQVAKKYL
jgi:hypothetical protein